jgi:hypothetical protein
MNKQAAPKSFKAAGKASVPAQKTVKSSLYDADFYSWVQEQVALLQAGRVHEIDATHIAEELGDMGRSEYRALESALRVLLTHLLKWDHQPEKRSRSWIFSIKEGRRRYHSILKDNPGLKSQRDKALHTAYEDARETASFETFLPVKDFPKNCPYEWDDILERPFEMDPSA